VDHYERQVIETAGDIQALRDQLTSSTSTVQQLQSSLDATSIESKESLQVAQEATDKLNQLQKQHAALREKIQVLESQNKTYQTEKADIIRVHSAEIEAERRAIRNLRRSIESIERGSGSKDERSSVLVLTNEELQREIMSLKELREGEEQESRRLRKEVEDNNLVVSALEEKNKILLEALTAEKERLSDQVDNLQRQLIEAQLRIQELSLHAQSQGVSELKRKEELQKTNATLDEQRTVIQRLQQSIGELSKDDCQPPKPRLLLNVMKSDPSRTHVQQSHSSSSASNSVSSRPSPPAKRYSTGGSEIHAASVAPSTSSTPLKTFKATTPPDYSSYEGSRMLTEHEHAFQADSDSEGDRHSGSQRQLKDIKRGKQQAQTSFVYRMGHAVFGSLWQRVWG
jgi:chromosome segregation ATPase